MAALSQLERDQLHSDLTNLLPAQVEEIIFGMKINEAQLPARVEAPTKRAMDLIRLAENAGRIDELRSRVSRAMGGNQSREENYPVRRGLRLQDGDPDGWYRSYEFLIKRAIESRTPTGTMGITLRVHAESGARISEVFKVLLSPKNRTADDSHSNRRTGRGGIVGDKSLFEILKESQESKSLSFEVKIIYQGRDPPDIPSYPGVAIEHRRREATLPFFGTIFTVNNELVGVVRATWWPRDPEKSYYTFIPCEALPRYPEEIDDARKWIKRFDELWNDPLNPIYPDAIFGTSTQRRAKYEALLPLVKLLDRDNVPDSSPGLSNVAFSGEAPAGSSPVILADVSDPAALSLSRHYVSHSAERPPGARLRTGVELVTGSSLTSIGDGKDRVVVFIGGFATQRTETIARLATVIHDARTIARLATVIHDARTIAREATRPRVTAIPAVDQYTQIAVWWGSYGTLHPMLFEHERDMARHPDRVKLVSSLFRDIVKGGRELVVVAHSTGAVLAFAALSSLFPADGCRQPTKPPVRLLLLNPALSVNDPDNSLGKLRERIDVWTLSPPHRDMILRVGEFFIKERLIGHRIKGNQDIETETDLKFWSKYLEFHSYYQRKPYYISQVVDQIFRKFP